MNIYSDSSHSAIKYLKDTEFNIQNLLIITGDFNVHDSLWDPIFNHHSSISDDIFVIADSFNLDLSFPIDKIPTRYSNNANDSNSVIDLMFLHCDSSEMNTHIIHPKQHLISDHAPLTITIPIVEEQITTCKRTITKNSEEENEFVKEVIAMFSKLDMSNILDTPKLEKVVSDFADIVDCTWMKYSKLINIIKWSKSWWNKEYNKDLTKYKSSRSREDWKTFRKSIKNTKRNFFDLKIQEIANKKHGPWELHQQLSARTHPCQKHFFSSTTILYSQRSQETVVYFVSFVYFYYYEQVKYEIQIEIVKDITFYQPSFLSSQYGGARGLFYGLECQYS